MQIPVREESYSSNQGKACRQKNSVKRDLGLPTIRIFKFPDIRNSSQQAKEVGTNADLWPSNAALVPIQSGRNDWLRKFDGTARMTAVPQQPATRIVRNLCHFCLHNPHAVVATPIFLPLNEFKSNGRFRKNGYEKPATSGPSPPMDK